MTIHVGIFPDHGELSYYNDVEKNVIDVYIETVNFNETEKVCFMYEKIKSKIKGNQLGCVCIYLDIGNGNEIRKKFVEEGLKSGFKNVEIIYWYTALYIHAMSQINCKPVNGNVVWIFWDMYVFVWQINDGKAKDIGPWLAETSKLNKLKEIVDKSKLKKGPDIVLYKGAVTDEANLRKISATCQIFIYKTGAFWESRASLLKARITAGDNDLAHLHVSNSLSDEITIKFGDKEIASFKLYQHLPIDYSQKLTKTNFNRTLKIETGAGEEISFELPNYKNILLRFEIDTNEIYHVTFIEHPKESILSSKEHPRNSVAKLNYNKTSDFSSVKNFNIPSTLTPSNTKINIIGIDLGTSRCCAAVNRKSGIVVVQLDNTGERLLPSYISYDEENAIFGKTVMTRLRNFSKSIIFDSKRIIGRNINDIEIDSNWPFRISQKNDHVVMEIRKSNVAVGISAEEVAADLLKFIKKRAEDFQGIKLSNAVITVPAAFSEAQKAATLKAAKMAGFNENTKLLPEPIAAAFAYFIDRTIPNNSNVLLFDLGGGTLDVCVFKIENDQIQILSNTGDTKLGGRDFDTILFNHYRNQLDTKHGISWNKDKKYKLILECQRIKEDLTAIKSVCLNVDEYDPNSSEIITLKREEFESVTKPLLNRIRNTLLSAIHDSKCKENEINKILLVGGGSRMPMIQDLLKKMFRDSEHICEEHPDEVVAIGAAYYACTIFTE